MAGRLWATRLTSLGLSFLTLEEARTHLWGSSGLDVLWSQMLHTAAPCPVSHPPTPCPVLSCEVKPPSRPVHLLTAHVVGSPFFMHLRGKGKIPSSHASSICLALCTVLGQTDDLQQLTTISHPCQLGPAICGPDPERRELEAELASPTPCLQRGCLDWSMGSHGSQTLLEAHQKNGGQGDRWGWEWRLGGAERCGSGMQAAGAALQDGEMGPHSSVGDNAGGLGASWSRRSAPQRHVRSWEAEPLGSTPVGAGSVGERELPRTSVACSPLSQTRRQLWVRAMTARARNQHWWSQYLLCAVTGMHTERFLHVTALSSSSIP
uniref:uncharacterized protein LOC114670345 n=1 Tax=Macaca mulatta TaxID=9544 RepID=UPI0010A2A28E|nr:uncharacterized protein LOC114670345 [Macaca mulatta]